MPVTEQSPRQPTDDWQQLRLLVTSSEQATYELLRPLVLFGQPVRARARETGVAEDRVASGAAGLELRGLVLDDGGWIAPTPVGLLTLKQIIESGRAELSKRCAVWQCDDDPEAAAALRRVATSLVEQVPAGSAVAAARPTVDL